MKPAVSKKRDALRSASEESFEMAKCQSYENKVIRTRSPSKICLNVREQCRANVLCVTHLDRRRSIGFIGCRSLFVLMADLFHCGHLKFKRFSSKVAHHVESISNFLNRKYLHYLFLLRFCTKTSCIGDAVSQTLNRKMAITLAKFGCKISSADS